MTSKRPIPARAGESLQPSFSEMTGMTSSSAVACPPNPLIRRTPLVAGRTFMTGSEVWGEAEEAFQNDARNGSEVERPSMIKARFSPFYSIDQLPRKRIGVPGHQPYPQSAKVLKLWEGSSYKAVFNSMTFRYFSILTIIVCCIGAHVDYTDNMRATKVGTGITASLRMLCIFTLTSFLGHVINKVNTRFENVCKTNGYVTRLSAQAVALYSKRDAWMLMRYTNSILHVYYELMSGPMDSAKWDRMVARGMLTKGEVAKLQLQGSPGVILYIWAIKILRHNHGPCGGGFRQLSNVKSGGRGGENNSEGIEAPGTAPAESERLLKEINMWASGLLPLQLNMEACVGGTRGLAAKQIAYTLCQFPSIYYQAVHVSVNMYLLCGTIATGHNFARAMDESCSSFAEYPRPNKGDDESTDERGCCWSAAVTILFEQFMFLFVFIGLFKAADHLADAYGNKAYHYDLGVDLDGLWQESQNALKSMDVPSPIEELEDHDDDALFVHGDQDIVKIE